MEHVDLPRLATVVPLHLSLDPWWDRLTCLAYGRCDDGLAPGQVLGLEDEPRLQWVLDAPGGDTVIGFRALEPFELDVERLDDDELWSGPRFDVPALGLVGASTGEVLLAVRGRYARGEATDDAASFHAAISATDLEEAARWFRWALEAGKMEAHFGLGYTLVELGRAGAAYAHLRRYTELVPSNSWAWSWLGRACEARGDRDEARAAYLRAVELDAAEDDDDLTSDAQERLAALEEDA